MTALLGRIAAGWAVLAGLVLAAIVLVTTANAALFTANRLAELGGGTVAGLPGYEEFVRLATSAAALMFLPWCQARRGHVTVELVAEAMGPRVRRGLDRAWLLGMAALALFLAGWMAVGMAETRADGVTSPVLGWPEWPFYLPGLVSLVLWAAIAAWQGIADPDG